MDANPTLDQIRVFLTVAEEGSFSAAARRLNRAQSVISYAIANLEEQLQVRLFERAGTRQPRLTEEGRILLEDARRMDGSLQLMRARARGLAQGLEGEISLAVDVMVPIAVLTRVLCTFRQAYPTVGVRLHTSALGGVSDLVLRREADLGIAGKTGLEADHLVARRVGVNQIIPVCAPDHPLAREGEPVPATIVREHFQIVITDPTEQTRGTDFQVHAFNTWRVTDATTKHALIREGLGWGGLPEWMVRDDVAAGWLVALDLEPYPRAEYLLYAMRAGDAPHGPAASWIVDRFEEELGRFAGNRAAAT